jgi:hypothetical protein
MAISQAHRRPLRCAIVAVSPWAHHQLAMTYKTPTATARLQLQPPDSNWNHRWKADLAITVCPVHPRVLACRRFQDPRSPRPTT